MCGESGTPPRSGGIHGEAATHVVAKTSSRKCMAREVISRAAAIAVALELDVAQQILWRRADRSALTRRAMASEVS